MGNKKSTLDYVNKMDQDLKEIQKQVFNINLDPKQNSKLFANQSKCRNNIVSKIINIRDELSLNENPEELFQKNNKAYPIIDNLSDIIEGLDQFKNLIKNNNESKKVESVIKDTLKVINEYNNAAMFDKSIKDKEAAVAKNEGKNNIEKKLSNEAINEIKSSLSKIKESTSKIEDVDNELNEKAKPANTPSSKRNKEPSKDRG